MRRFTKLISSSKITISSISKSPIQNLNSNALFKKPYKTHQLYENPSQDYTTDVGIRLYFPSNESKNKEALIHQGNFADAKGCLEIACRVLDKMEKSKPLEVADAYIKIADQYETMNDVETAISLLLRALALLEKLLEEQHLEGSVLTRIGCLLLLTDKVTQAMAIGVIYAGLEEYEKVAEENQLTQKVFRICGCSEDVIRVGIEAANMLISRGRYEAAMKTLEEQDYETTISKSYEPYKTHQPYKNPSQNCTTHESDEGLDMLRGVFYKNPISNLSNAYGAAMNRSIRFFSTGVPSHPPSLFKQNKQTGLEMWRNCPVTREVVQIFKAAVIYDEYVVSPGVAMPSRQIIHVDSRTRIYKDDFCQFGMISRSEEGTVLWSTVSKCRINELMPRRWEMERDKPDVNFGELAVLGYLAIRISEMRLSGSEFMVLTDSLLAHIYMGRTENKITKKSHKYLTLLIKKLWFYSRLKRVIWVSNVNNVAADGLSRAKDVKSSDDEEMQKYEKAVKEEASNFYQRIQQENVKEKGGGVDVEKADNFEIELREFMR